MTELEKRVFTDFVIAVDFDNTLAFTSYPKIICPNNPVIDFIKEEHKKGSIIILNTCRCGVHLENALLWLNDHEVPIDLVNENTKDRISLFQGDSRKISADLYIDDKSVNPLLEHFQIRSYGIKEEHKRNLKSLERENKCR